jgi:two-component system chemotaxis sensor kinase CheA
MSFDMESLRKMFYEECRDNLDVLEQVLLNYDLTSEDEEQINTIFRAAHSIKGGAGTFDLLDISEFTHSIETYLDLARNKEVTLNPNSIDLLLKSCDCILDMLVAHEQGGEANHTEIERVKDQVAQLLPCNAGDSDLSSDTATETKTDEPQSDVTASSEAPEGGEWHIEFIPNLELFFSGNDPLRIIRELFELNTDCKVMPSVEKLPSLEEIEGELCYLSWHIIMPGSVTRKELNEVFEWVEDDCELEIKMIVQEAAPSVNDVEVSTPLETSESTPKPSAQKAKSSTNSAKTDTKAVKADSSVSSIRVDIDKVDSLINLVGELVITQSMLNEIGNDFTLDKLEKLKAGLAQLLQNSKDLQENVLNIRMLPMSFAFSRFPRLVRDLSSRLDKNVELIITGEHTELDKTVLERIVDPLVHLVRNGIDHGIENPEVRVENNKREQGLIELNAYHQGGAIVIEVKDDGAGIDCDKLWNKAKQKGVVSEDMRREDMTDKQITNLIFAPGFSTAEEVSDVSGRGVGMDVVKRNIEELGGHIEVESNLGSGSCFTINLPLTLAILDGQLVKVAGEVYIIPLLTIVESIQIDTSCIKLASGGVELYRLREENIPILRLQDELSMGNSGEIDKHILCFVEAAGNRVGILIDELLDQQQVVIKSLESNYAKVTGISGATILGDGSVSLILDIQGLITSYLNKAMDSQHKKIVA